jgi:hypothetical protein
MHWRNNKKSYDRVQSKAKGYVKENWGSPFILAFMLLLLGAAISLSIGLQYTADSIAVYAFYALVIGVVLQLASFLKYRQKNEVENLQ